MPLLEEVRRLRSLAVCVCALLLGWSPAWGFTPAPETPLARKVHPRLHFTPESLPRVREAISRHYRAEFNAYVRWAASAPADHDTNRLNETGHDPFRALMIHEAFLGMLGRVEGIVYPAMPEELGRRAVATFLARLEAGQKLAYAAALTYDWTFNAMTAEERVRAAKLMAARPIEHKVFSETLEKPGFRPEQLFSSKYYEGFYAFFLGLALWGDGPADAEADRAVDTFAPTMLGCGYLDAHNFIAGQDGGQPEWIGYSSWHPRTHIVLVDGWRTATGEDYLAKRRGEVDGNAILRFPELVWYAVDPHRYFGKEHTFIRMGDAQTTDSALAHDSMREQIQMLPRPLFDAGAATQAGLLRSFADEFRVPFLDAPYQYLMAWIGLARSVPPVTPAAAGLRPARWMRAMGAFFARTGFTKPSDTVFFVTDGHFYTSGHGGVQHEPGFGIAKFGELVNTRNVSHRGYGNLDAYPGAHPHNIVYFEGGHEAKPRVVDRPADLKQALGGRGGFDRGGIEQVTRRDGLFYHVRSDRSRAFTAGVKHTRELVFLPAADSSSGSDLVVAYDRTHAPSAPEWVYHVPWRPLASGCESKEDIATGKGEKDRIGERYRGAGVVIQELNAIGDDLDDAKGRRSRSGGAGAHGTVFCRTLLPSPAVVEATRVAALDKDVLKRQFHLAIKSHRWQVSVKPVVEAIDHRFLHVFQTGEASRLKEMARATLLEAGGSHHGVFIEGEGREGEPAYRPAWVVLFAREAGVHSGSVKCSIRGSGTVRHLVAGLIPGRTYRISEGASSRSISVEAPVEANVELWDYRGAAENVATGVLCFEGKLDGAAEIAIEPQAP